MTSGSTKIESYSLCTYMIPSFEVQGYDSWEIFFVSCQPCVVMSGVMHSSKREWESAASRRMVVSMKKENFSEGFTMPATVGLTGTCEILISVPYGIHDCKQN
ncbi:hypothetical protein [Methanolobus halotolerans]|uniref:Uncharacterized protein n=1 Tax=Methanolobus halotolerans TaxID=2052935 RepID=A0A4E0Q7D9_9EURY|nr:hypothetical protein [Methanolobus halotolerans]TGC06934.1 hypothetical protein CUN85_12400 [Methanolobus halotolerans]